MNLEDDFDLRLTVKGFARVQLLDRDGHIKGDTGWLKNAIQLNKGWYNFIGYCLMGSANSCLVSHMALMTMNTASSLVSTSLSAAQTNASSAINGVVRISNATNNGFILCTAGKTIVTQSNGIILRHTGQFNSNTIKTGSPGEPINVLGVFNTTVAAGSTYNPLAAVKFNSSTLDSDQLVRATYEFRFGQ